MNSKHVIMSLLSIALLLPITLEAQKKVKDGKKLKEEKEWVIDKKGKKKLSFLVRYNADGQKIEEIDYAATAGYGQKSRITFEYNADGKTSKKTYYDERDKLYKTVVPEYDEAGIKIKETTYLPNGKVDKVKEFEYIY